MKRFSIAAGLIFLLSFTLFAQTYRESLRSAENYFRVKNYSAARAEAIRAKELAASEEEKLAGGLLLAKIPEVIPLPVSLLRWQPVPLPE